MGIFLLTLSLILIAAAPSDTCREHYAALRYRDAITACTDALPAAADRAELYTLIGLSLAGVGETEKARRVFAALLAFKLDAALPGGLSPKLKDPFDAARADSVPISITAARDRDDVVIIITDGPSRPVAELRVGPNRVARAERVKAPAATRVTALDVLGGEIATVEIVTTAPQPAVTAPAPSTARPLLLSWKVWLIGTVVLAAASGAAFAWAAGTFPRARSEEWADRAGALHAEAQRAQVISGVGFSLAGLAAIAALILGVTE